MNTDIFTKASSCYAFQSQVRFSVSAASFRKNLIISRIVCDSGGEPYPYTEEGERTVGNDVKEVSKDDDTPATPPPSRSPRSRRHVSGDGVPPSPVALSSGIQHFNHRIVAILRAVRRLLLV